MFLCRKVGRRIPSLLALGGPCSVPSIEVTHVVDAVEGVHRMIRKPDWAAWS